MSRPFAALAGLAALAFAGPAWAGPPYATDDPAPTDPGHWEVYGFVGGAHVDGLTEGEGGLDLNYGAAPGLQLTVVLPFSYEHDGGTRIRRGEVELAAKYQFLRQAEGSARPDLAIFPRVFLPGADGGRANLLLPIWAQKDFGRWSMFGGGGYQINPGAGNRNFWTGGLALTRQLNQRLSLGAEVYGHSADADDASAFAGVNLGVSYRMAEHWSLLAAGGPGIANAREEGRYAFYLALKADY